MNIYIVKGHTGEYDDCQEWNAFAFKTEQAAIDKIARLQEMLEALGLTYRSFPTLDDVVWHEGARKVRDHKNGDKKARCDYTGIKYNYEGMTLDE